MSAGDIDDLARSDPKMVRYAEIAWSLCLNGPISAEQLRRFIPADVLEVLQDSGVLDGVLDESDAVESP